MSYEKIHVYILISMSSLKKKSNIVTYIYASLVMLCVTIMNFSSSGYVTD